MTAISLKYSLKNVAGLATGALVALAPVVAFGQTSPRMGQQPATRRAAPSSAGQTGNTSDLPIGVQQGLADAKRYQELRQRAERLGQAPPPLPYARPNTILIFQPPLASGIGNQAPIQSPTPGDAASAPAQSIQSPMTLPAQPRLPIRQTPPPAPQTSAEMERLQLILDVINNLNGGGGGGALPSLSPAPSAPASQRGGAIQMSSPRSGGRP